MKKLIFIYLLTLCSLYAKENIIELKAKAESGDAKAQYDLGFYYRDGKGVEKNDTEAAKWFNKAAEQGLVEAEIVLSDFYEKRENYIESLKWYKKLAERGFPHAQTVMGNFYGLKKDYVEAAKWYMKAAEQGNIESQCQLATYYMDGKGVEKNYTEAAKWWLIVAEANSTPKSKQVGQDPRLNSSLIMYAQHQLGRCYDDGKGVNKDYVEAVKWYKKAAEQGFANAQFSLGAAFYVGTGVNKDYVEAAKWYTKAAEQGHIYAMFMIGTCYDEGRGVMKNSKESYAYMNIAAGSLSEVRNILNEMEKKMTPEQIEAGQRRSAEILKEIETTKIK